MFRLAAEQGNPVAQNRLAAALRQWRGRRAADPVQAAKWHLLAREAASADFALDILLAKLTPSSAPPPTRQPKPGATGGCTI